MTVTRPMLRYHGGKWKLAPWLVSLFPSHRIYVEPFGGGGSVLLRKPRSYAEIYNDLDGEIVNLFRVVREQGEQLRRALELTPFARDEFVESYEPSSDPIEQARRTVVRSYMGFGSNSHVKKTGFRANSNRSGTTPAHDWRNYPDALVAIIERLRAVVIENRDACEVMAAQDSPDTLHYVDPPYVHSTRMERAGVDRVGYNHEMDDAQHRALGNFLKSLRGGVILSGYACPLYDEIFSDWQRIEKPALADGARERTEVVWMRNIQPDLLGLTG